MTREDHYAEAMLFARRAERQLSGDEHPAGQFGGVERAYSCARGWAALAQVHATLAAGEVFAGDSVRRGSEMSDPAICPLCGKRKFIGTDRCGLCLLALANEIVATPKWRPKRWRLRREFKRGMGR